MRVIGIDENGLGPILGPMIISGCSFEIEQDIFFSSKKKEFGDSKKIFKRAEKWTYSKGEIIALSLLKVRSLFEILDKVEIIIEEFEKQFYINDIKLPIWAKFVSDQWTKNVNFIDFKGYAIFPMKFNEMLKQGHKFFIDLKYFLETAHYLSDERSIALCGKIGGYTYYSKIFHLLGIKNFKILKENKGHSAYKVHYKDKELEIHFILDGDENYYPISIASIIGKYLRELFMMNLNVAFGSFDEIPYSSGYKHDKKTYELLEKISHFYSIENFTRRK
jgi:ribonuclease HII